MSEKIFKSFGEWWFLVGGSIHSLWKDKKYSDIKTLALTLPRNAWDYRQKEIDQLKTQIEKMKCRENCGNDFEISNNTSCPLYDFQNVRCPCDKWEMMK